MKLSRLAIIALLLAVGTATADQIVAVDFSGISTTIDLTVPNSLPLNGVTFQYDPQSGSGWASADGGGIYGSQVSGALNLTFDIPIVGLMFAYNIEGLDQGATSCPTIDCLDVSLGNGSYLPYTAPADTVSIGSFANQNIVPFTTATLYFSSDGSAFDLPSLSYDTVPEPASFLPFGAALLGLAGSRKFLKRRA